MRTFSGIPSLNASAPPVVLILSDADPLRALLGGPFAWGKEPDPKTHRGVVALAQAILRDVLGPLQVLRADGLALRFAWRTLKTYKADSPWQLSDAQVLGVVEQIEEVSRQTSGMRARVALETAPRVSEGGTGVGGGRIEWTKTGRS